MNSTDFVKDYLWVGILIIVGFTAYVAYLLNQNIDPSDAEEDDDLNQDTHED
jgi:hypothetical protein